MKIQNMLQTAVVMLAACFLSSCDDWLNVPVDGQSTSKELFLDGDGYRSALHGLYNNMARPTLYGKELQYGLIDFFSNQYKTDLPERYFTDVKYTEAAKHNFQNTQLVADLDQIFLSSYNIIAAANDLINNVAEADAKKFREKEMERDMIHGEALAIRAFVHFDMLRLYAPAPRDDDQATHIPYLTTFPEIKGQHIPVKEFIEKVIADLENARKLVKTYDDTPLGISTSVNGNARLYNELQYGLEGANDPSKVDAFFMGRGYRFTYWGITALLARVYQYGAHYDRARYELAANCAKEVIEAQVKANGNTYNPFKDENFEFMWDEQPDQMQGLRMPSTLIFAVYNKQQVKDAGVDANFPLAPGIGAGKMFVVDVEGQDIFKTADGKDERENDIRYTRLLYAPRGAEEIRLSTKWYVPTGYSPDGDKKLNILPLIRTSEMRYIIAETEARNGKYAEAYGILNEMRRNRGLQEELPVATTLEGFTKDLVREAQREWISEGQLFYLYKRLGASVKRADGTSKPFTKEETVLPLPINETL